MYFPEIIRRHAALIALGVTGLSICGVLLAQKPFKDWPAIEYTDFPLPADYQKKAEWTRARLRYPDIYGYPFVELAMGDRLFPGYWTMDYPRSDRHLLEGVRRLTRIDTRSVEQVVSFDGSDDMFNYPMLYAVEVGHWKLRDQDAAQLREFLIRGGFLMVDDFHGNVEWSNFTQGMNRVFPDRPIVELPPGDPIFHVLYDLDERVQAPGADHYFRDHLTYESGMGNDLNAGKIPHWRGIYDDRGRVMVAICHNMDLGDAWEHSDEAEYPEKLASFAYRLGMNYFIYDLSH
jgi:hypothetical protein